MSQTKITVIGDMMCEPFLFKAAKSRGGFDFSPVFSHVRDLFQQSDLVIGNLETPLAGEAASYVKELFSFNAPKEFALAAKEAGVSLVSTANNHCIDRGFEGLLETVKALDEVGLAHVGTYDSPGQKNRTFYREINGQTIGVVAYTYGANYSMHHRALSKEQEKCINILRPYTESVFLATAGKKSFAKRAINKAISGFKRENQAAIKKALGLTYNTPRKDDAINPETAAPYLDQFRQDIRSAKEKADVVLVLPHVGGQFNLEPGAFTELVMQAAKEAGADAIIASHPHIVQKAACNDSIPCFYSIGNFSMSPNSVYLLHEDLPDYGLAVHLYIEEKRIVRTTFSILKIVEPKGKMLTVYPADEYLNQAEDTAAREKTRKDIGQIYTAVTQKTFDGIVKQEYVLD